MREGFELVKYGFNFVRVIDVRATAFHDCNGMEAAYKRVAVEVTQAGGNDSGCSRRAENACSHFERRRARVLAMQRMQTLNPYHLFAGIG